MVKSRYRGSHSDLVMRWPKSPRRTEPLLADLEQQLHLSRLEEKRAAPSPPSCTCLTPRGYFAQALDEFAAEAGVTPDIARQALEAVQALETYGHWRARWASIWKCSCIPAAAVDPLCYDLINLYLLDIVKGNTRQIAMKQGPRRRASASVWIPSAAFRPRPSLRRKRFTISCRNFRWRRRGQCAEHPVPQRLLPTLQQDATSRLAETGRGTSWSLPAGCVKLGNPADPRGGNAPDHHGKGGAHHCAGAERLLSGAAVCCPSCPSGRVAEEVGVHETTIYRTLQNKLPVLRQRHLRLCHFFQKEVSAGTSTVHVKEIIQEICREKVSN